MPTNEIITIINNSGKVISTGKHLVNIFKEAQAAYKDRKDAVKAERSAVRRAKTFDVSRGDPYYDNYPYPSHDDNDHVYDRRALTDGGFDRRHSHDYDDSRSYASSRHSRRSRRPRSSERPFPALTEGNLKTHSEVSATTPSRAYQSPYAETVPRDMQLSRPTLAIGPPPQLARSDFAPAAGPMVLAPPPERTQLVHRPAFEAPVLAKRKSIDMNLAYGDVPPDLESRVDLDRSEPEEPGKAQAMTLMDRIEDFLEEAHCVQHTASSMIESLQRNPQAAAAVALSLAELSTLIGKMSPAFLGFLKGGSPAVFALLASPQFLIGAGVAVGVTVVMFGGWKIVKRATAPKTLEAPLEMRVLPSLPPPTVAPEKALPPPPAGGSAAEYDEALVLRDVEELSSIESWRRGIVAYEDAESADVELMSRQAERDLKEQYEEEEDEDYFDDVKPCDSVSQVSWARSDRTRRTHRTHKTSSRRHEVHRDEDPEVPERKSSKKPKDDGASDDGASVAGSEKSTRSHRSSNSSKSHRHEGSTVSRSSKRLTAIEEGDGEDSGSTAGKHPKEKKRDMIKQLFKMKKDKEDREKAHSVMV
ncbi:hypothetical protein C8A05DRAFT_14462 [Staphylotrichum tortipilum]|uniref:Uncharacterized protein n=1 Tax=Staphylotrichum tortipilum TaxID=2831512 RepID=A0AAN6MPF4_9PEZI|nr:hypothetical protein C8A05DRAFT_14462 [Staphylotrichum longicolle]